MNALETARLCSIITSLNPAQRFDDETPTVWHAVLVDVSLADGLEAVKRIAQRSPWVSAAEICAEVKVIRKGRIQSSDSADELVPNVDPDDVAAFQAERLAIMRAAAAGTLDSEAYAASGQTLSGVPARRALDPTVTPRPERVEAMLGRTLRAVRVPRG